jgi:hypothetical protein
MRFSVLPPSPGTPDIAQVRVKESPLKQNSERPCAKRFAEVAHAENKITLALLVLGLIALCL